MTRPALLLLLLLATPLATAHEKDFPLPFLAQGGGTDNAAANPARPQQAAGQRLTLKPTRDIAFDTDEGTWMSPSLSPDGKTIALDLLGDLYLLDANGGKARPLTRGMGFDSQPAWSPDGQSIAFLSDRSGAENLWVMRADGSQPRQISFGDDESALVSPAWSPDGKSLYVSRFRWSVDGYDLWRYELDGTETLVVPVMKKGQTTAGTSSLGAVVSPDGRDLYFARRIGRTDSEKLDNWSIVRRDIASGTEQVLLPSPTGSSRGATAGAYFRPQLSPDGQWLAYATRYLGQTGLRVRHLDSGEDRWVAYPIEHDQIQARSWQDLVPGYTFSRDGKAVILSRNGKLERLPVAAGATVPIPFTASVKLELGPLTRVAVKENTGPVRARLIQNPEASPDGQSLAFSALGHVYVMPLDGTSSPRRLTTGDTPEFHPSWSPDGRSLAYVTWSSKGAGQVWTVPATGGPPHRVSQRAAYYTQPVFTPDGRNVLAVRSEQQAKLDVIMEFGLTRQAELVSWPTTGGQSRVLHTGVFGGKPHFSVTPDVVYLKTPEGLSAFSLTGKEVKPAVQVQGPGWYFMNGSVPVDDLRISPDGRWVLAFIAQQLHVLATPKPGEVVDLSHPDRVHRRITDVGADFFEWADGGKTITWSVGSTFQRRALADVTLNAADRPGWSADVSPAHTQTYEAVVEVPRDTPRGNLLLQGARVISMRGDEVIEAADILVSDNRIAAVGPTGTLQVPADAAVRDLRGKTIVPGFIDIHDHGADIRRDVQAMDSWGLSARLAYGVTTSFDPSTLSIDRFPYQDLIDAGVITGSRAPSTGMALFSYNRLSSLSEARALLSRYRDHYHTPNVKQYLIGNRRQRQWLVQAAAEMGVAPTTEGSLALKQDLTHIIDGYAGSEHALATPIYRDVIELLARSGTAYDTTLQILNGGPGAQDNFVARDRPLSDSKFLRTRPHVVAAASGDQRLWSDPSNMLFPRLGGDAARVQRAGGVIGMGSHGEIPGPGFHWEMEAHVMGGMTPLEAIRAGTLGSATAIGRAGELGSIEPGKFADLAILDRDPRNDIRHTTTTFQVMKNGRLYDASSLDELWPRQKAFEPAWFADQAPTPR